MNDPQSTTQNLQPIRILVTGGAGFIGSHVVDALVEAGHEVAVVDNLSTGSRDNLNSKAKFFEVDVCNRDELSRVFDEFKPEAIFHLAAQASVNDSIKNPGQDVCVNVIGTINLLELARDNNCRKFIFSSTGGAIYGDKAERPTKETAEEKPLTPYGMDKLAAEKYIEFFAANYGIKPVILRYANVYGPRQNPHGEAGVIAIFTKRLLDGEKYTLFGDGEQTRDFIFVGDVVRANLKALNFDKFDIFNIGSSTETSINQVVEFLQKASGIDQEPIHLPARIEQRNSSLSSSKARTTLKWEPTVSVEIGLKRTIDYFKNVKK